ncbi:MAG: hypothetical protein HRU36_01095, partial [Rickettsiales bacterium]|nr:hypothetical protein [Rickettsiales bacterium]
GLTSFNPTHAATSALLAGAKCGIQQYGVSDEYNSILPVIDLMQTGMNMLTPTNIAMQVVSGMSAANQVLDLYNAETNLFETISGTISNFFSTEEHILG